MSSATMHFDYGFASSSSTLDVATSKPQSPALNASSDWALFSMPSVGGLTSQESSYVYAPGSAFSDSPSPSSPAMDDMEHLATPPSSASSVRNYASADAVLTRGSKASLAPIDVAAANAASFDLSSVPAFTVDMSPSLDSQPRRPATSHVAGSLGRLSTGGTWHSLGRCTSADAFSWPTYDNGAPVSSAGALGGLNITWEDVPRSDKANVAVSASSFASIDSSASSSSSSSSSSVGPDTPFTTAATVGIFSPFTDAAAAPTATPATAVSSYASPFFLPPVPMCPDGTMPSVLGGHGPTATPSPMLPQGVWTGSAPTLHRAHLGFQQPHPLDYGHPSSSASSVPLSWVPSFQGLPSPQSNPGLFAPNGRILLACSFCKYRKLRCDGGLPQCTQCSKRGNQCCYPTEVRRRGKAKKTKLKEAKEAEVVAAVAAGAMPAGLPLTAQSDAERALKRRRA